MGEVADFERVDRPVTAQPPPVPQPGVPGVHDAVVAELGERARFAGYTEAGALGDLARLLLERGEFGARKYGTPLQPGNGRDPLADALEEALDTLAYLWQAVMEGRPAARALFAGQLQVAKALVQVVALPEPGEG